MIDTILKMFRGAVSIFIAIQLLVVILAGIGFIVAQEGGIGFLILIGGFLFVVIFNGILCVFLKIEEHLSVLRKSVKLNEPFEKDNMIVYLENQLEMKVTEVYTRRKDDTKWKKELTHIRDNIIILAIVKPFAEHYDFKIVNTKGNQYTKLNIQVRDEMTIAFTENDQE